jgi:hypothetical protein
MKFHGFPSNEQILREVRLRSCDLILLITWWLYCFLLACAAAVGEQVGPLDSARHGDRVGAYRPSRACQELLLSDAKYYASSCDAMRSVVFSRACACVAFRNNSVHISLTICFSHGGSTAIATEFIIYWVCFKTASRLIKKSFLKFSCKPRALSIINK